MSNKEDFICERCQTPFQRGADGDPELRLTVCPVCVKLGDRSLVWFQRAMREATTDEEKSELRARFAAAKGRSWMLPDVLREVEAGHRLPSGLYQMERERR